MDLLIDINALIESIDSSKSYRITVKADTNDADYISETSRITGVDFLIYVIPLLVALRNPNGKSYHNWQSMKWGLRDGDILPKDLYDLTGEQIE